MPKIFIYTMQNQLSRTLCKPYMAYIGWTYTLDKFYVQESDRVLRLYWASFLNEKVSLSDPLMILGFDSVPGQ